MSKDRKPYPSETQDRFIIRFPDGMRDRIRELAEQNGRSMNAEIIHRLEQSLDPSSVNVSGVWTTVSDEGRLLQRGAKELLSELQELTQKAQLIVHIFQTAQNNLDPVDISDPPDFDSLHDHPENE